VSSVKGHFHGGGGPVAAIRHHAIAGNEMADEQTHTSRIKRLALKEGSKEEEEEDVWQWKKRICRHCKVYKKHN
jgi:hypothetical protein